ncbi:MAG: hypothetical protein ACRC57_10515 [Sarcina sp.]
MKKIFFKFIFVLELCISIFALLFSLSIAFSDYLAPLPPDATFWAKYYIPFSYSIISLFFIYDIFNKISIKYNFQIYLKYNFQIIKIKNKTKTKISEFSLYFILGICSIFLVSFTVLHIIGFIILISLYLDFYRYLKIYKKKNNSVSEI